MNFRQLLDSVRFDRPNDQPPKTWTEIARLLAISVPHLHSLMGGRRSAPEWTVARIAARLGRSAQEVQKALNQSRTEAGSEKP